MRGHLYTTDTHLTDGDMAELVDELAIKLTGMLGERVFSLNRQDVGELIARYIEDLNEEDKTTVVWLVWDLLQDGMEEYYSN